MGNRRNAKILSLSGILLALTMITLFAATTLPTSRLSLYALSSFFVSIVIMELGVKNGWIFYIASCLLGLAVVPNKMGLLPYWLFFGIYGIVKFYIEKLNRLVPEYILKLAWSTGCMTVLLFLAKEFFSIHLPSGFPWWLAIVALEVAFIVYDYVYTLFIQYYLTKLKKVLWDR